MVRTTYEGRATTEAVAPPTAEVSGRTEHRPLADLVRELRDETTELLRSEVRLAKVEMSEKVSRVARNGVYAGIGGALAMASAVVLLLAASAGAYAALVAFADLPHMTAGWLGPLLVGLVGALIGYLLIHKGTRTISDEGFVPERTVESLREDKDWAERKVR